MVKQYRHVVAFVYKFAHLSYDRGKPRGIQPTERLTLTINPAKPLKIFSSLFIVIKNSQTWINGCYVGLLYAPSAAFAELWGVNFLTQTYHLARPIAGALIGTIFIGWTIGGPLTGWLSDRIGRRKPILLISSICGAVFMGIVILVPHLPLLIIFILLFCYGFTNIGVAISYAVASEINLPKVSGTSIAFANMASVLIGACFQPIIGWLLDLLWKGKTHNGIHLFSSTHYRLALLALPICCLLSFIIALKIKETNCRNIT